MSSAVSLSSSSSLIENTAEPNLSFFEDPKVQKVAFEVFKFIGCVGFGAVLGAITVSPLGAGALIIGVCAGGAFGAFCFLAITGVVEVVKKYGFPSNKYCIALPPDEEKWFSDKNRLKFQESFNEIKELEIYPTWKTANNFSSDIKAEKYLWKNCQKGLCQGQSQCLISLLQDHKIQGDALLKNLDVKTVFFRELLELIRADLPDDEEAIKLAFTIPNAEALSNPFSFSKKQLKKEPLLLCKTLGDLECEEAASAIAFTIRLQSKTVPCHMIFVQIGPDKECRFYDSSNSQYSGLHEGFNSKEQFLKRLQKHILAFESNARPGLGFDDIIIRLYKIERSEAKAAALIALAGANPIENQT